MLKKLKMLNLNNNNLVEIPDFIDGCVLLKELYISNNQICKISDNIGNLKLLKKIDVKNNDLSLIPFDLCLCVSLEQVDFSGNPRIENVPKKYLSDARIILYICGHFRTCSSRILHLEKLIADLESKLQKEHSLKTYVAEKLKELEEREALLLKERPELYLKMKRLASKAGSVICSLQ